MRGRATDVLGQIRAVLLNAGGIIPFMNAIENVAEHASASHGSYGVSAPCYSCAENIRIVPVLIPEFEYRDIERQVFAADFVERASAAFVERPEGPGG
jgi:hypothetical protein